MLPHRVNGRERARNLYERNRDAEAYRPRQRPDHSMSGDAMGFAVRHSPFVGVTYTIHLCLADAANDMHQNDLWMAMGTLAAKARCSRQATTSAMRDLVDGGWLAVITPPITDDGKPTGHPGRYRFLFPEDAEVVFENRGRGAKSVVTPSGQGDKSVVTGDKSVVTGVTSQLSHNPKGTQRQPWRQQPENDRSRAARERVESDDRTALAQSLKREANMERTAVLDAEPASERTLEYIAEIRRKRHEGKKTA